MATEREMFDLLHQRYGQVYGNGPRWARAEHVRQVGFFGDGPKGGPRSCDFMAMELWPASGMPLHGHEVKVSRSDFLRELAEPEKAETFRRYCDRWWLVVPDLGIVGSDLPDGWGVLTVDGRGRLRAARPAPRLDPEPIPRLLLASILRATQKTAERSTRRALEVSRG